MGLKKNCREINQAKNNFVKLLKQKKATSIEVYEGAEEDDLWDYYRHVSAFVGNNLYSVYFMVWGGKVEIDYSDEENRYNALTLDEFKALFD
jgi:hypothetical protein